MTTKLQVRSARANAEQIRTKSSLRLTGWYLTSAPIMTADWEAEDDAWTVPVGGGFGKLHRFETLPVNIQFRAFYNAEKPKGGPDWSTRFQIQLLFPR